MNHKILIDCMALLSPLAGIGRYNYEIAKELSQMDSDLQYSYFYGIIKTELILQEELKYTNNISKLNTIKNLIKKSQFAKKLAIEGLRIYNSAFYPKFDLYWQPNFIPRNHIKAKKIIATVHDFSWHIEPSWHPKDRVEHMQNNFWNSMKKVDRIITGSSFSKMEIVDFLGFDENKIDVIYHGVNHDVFYKTNEKTLDLPQNYILAVGSVEPRKNLATLLRAYASLDKDFKNEFKLVLVGFKGWNNNEIVQLINDNKDYVIYLGFVNDDMLREVYNRATVFVYPSLYEGFGIPPLEAMACGAPVISSNAASLPEACGDCAVYVDPKSQNEIANAISKLARDKDLISLLSNKGLNRAREFTWKTSAALHLNSFNKLL